MTEKDKIEFLRFLLNKMVAEYDQIGVELDDAEKALQNTDPQYSNANLILGSLTSTDVRLKTMDAALFALKAVAKLLKEDK